MTIMQTTLRPIDAHYRDYAIQVAELLDAYSAGFSAGRGVPPPADLTWSTPGRNEYVAACYQHAVPAVEAARFWPVYLASEEFPPSLICHPAWQDAAHRRAVRDLVRNAEQADGEF